LLISSSTVLADPLSSIDVRALRVYTAGALAALAIGCLALPASAFGLEPGVHADPGSPAAKQYSLPLNQARQTGAGPAGREGSSANVPFGAGIKPPGSGGSGRARSSAGGTRRGARRGAAGSSPTDPGRTVPAIVLRGASSRASSGGDGSLLTLLGGAVVILILGAFGGTLMRRSRRSLSSP
jgi:hypothetical protein